MERRERRLRREVLSSPARVDKVVRRVLSEEEEVRPSNEERRLHVLLSASLAARRSGLSGEASGSEDKAPASAVEEVAVCSAVSESIVLLDADEDFACSERLFAELDAAMESSLKPRPSSLNAFVPSRDGDLSFPSS